MLKKIIAVLLICTAIIACSMSAAVAQDNDSVGTVVAVRGGVTALDAQGKTRPLTLKSPIYRNDTIKTGPQGRIQVLFSDNTIISLGKSTELEISEHFWKPDQKTGAMKTKVKEGVFRVMGGAIAKDSPQNFTTETPAATIGIRGSMYAGRVTNGMLSVVFEGGRGINVTNTAGRVEISRPGLGTRIQALNVPPEKPKRFSTQELSNLNRDLSVEGQSQQGGSSSSNSEKKGDGAPADNKTGNAQAGSTASQDGQQASGGTGDSQTGSGSTGEQQQASQTSGTGESGNSQTAQEGGNTGSSFSIGAGSQTSDAPLTDAALEPTAGLTFTTYSDPAPKINPVDQVTGGTTTDENKAQQVQDSAGITTTPSPTATALSGRHFGTLADIADSANSSNTMWYGALNATSTDGAVSGSSTTQDGTVFSVAFSMNPYNTASTYSPPTVSSTVSSSRLVNLLGADRTIGMKTISDPLGEFAIYSSYGTFTAAQAFEYSELGFAGTPIVAANLPTSGIDVYSGSSLGMEMLTINGNLLRDYDNGDLMMSVNWLNGKALGVVCFDDQSPTNTNHKELPIFFLGDLDRTNGTLTNVRFMGSRGTIYGDTTGTIAWIEGASVSSAQFYGSAYQGFGFTGSAYDYSTQSSMKYDIGGSQILSAGFRQERSATAPVARTGSALFSGFAVGVAEDMNNPSVGRRRYINMDPGRFSFTINRDLGTLTGSLYNIDLDNVNASISNVDIGGAYGSAYIHDHLFAAVLGDTGNDGIKLNATSGGIKPHANYLITESPDLQFSTGQFNEYITWGYWELAYEEPGTLTQYHVHIPGAYWIAGELTPSTTLLGMTSTAVYTGGANGIWLDTGGKMNTLTNGLTRLMIDFNPTSANPVSGYIQFDQVHMDLQSGYVGKSNSEFSANVSINGAVTGNSGAYGAFYGPNANAVGGSFGAEDVVGNKYLGIFHGKTN